MEEFRQAAFKLGTVLAVESSSLLSKSYHPIKTPLTHTEGVFFKNDFILVPILRSGITMLPPFMEFYPNSPIGFIGTKRDELTAIPALYYINLPLIHEGNHILLLDPMLATGGSSILAVQLLKEAGAKEKQISLISFIASPDGVAHFKKDCPEAGLLVAQLDEGLDDQKRIVPGLGDFGDRYFGTV